MYTFELWLKLSLEAKFKGIAPPLVTQLLFPERDTKPSYVRHFVFTEEGKERYNGGVPLEELKLGRDYQLFIVRAKK